MAKRKSAQLEFPIEILCPPQPNIKEHPDLENKKARKKSAPSKAK